MQVTRSLTSGLGPSDPPADSDRPPHSRRGPVRVRQHSGTVYRIERQTNHENRSGLTATSFVPTDEALFT